MWTKRELAISCGDLTKSSSASSGMKNSSDEVVPKIKEQKTTTKESQNEPTGVNVIKSRKIVWLLYADPYFCEMIKSKHESVVKESKRKLKKQRKWTKQPF